MSTEKERLKAICKIISSEAVENQEQLIKRLNEEGFIVTQATLSRDIRQLKVAKIHDACGAYLYKLPEQSFLNTPKGTNTPYSNIEFSANLAIIKTNPDTQWLLLLISMPTHRTRLSEPLREMTPF